MLSTIEPPPTDEIYEGEGPLVSHQRLAARYFADWLFDRMGRPGPLRNSEYQAYRRETGRFALTRAQWTRTLTALLGGSAQVRLTDGTVERVRLFPTELLTSDTKEDKDEQSD